VRSVPKAARKICEANAPLLDVPLERLVMPACDSNLPEPATRLEYAVARTVAPAFDNEPDEPHIKLLNPAPTTYRLDHRHDNTCYGLSDFTFIARSLTEYVGNFSVEPARNTNYLQT